MPSCHLPALVRIWPFQIKTTSKKMLHPPALAGAHHFQANCIFLSFQLERGFPDPHRECWVPPIHSHRACSGFPTLCSWNVLCVHMCVDRGQAWVSVLKCYQPCFLKLGLTGLEVAQELDPPVPPHQHWIRNLHQLILCVGSGDQTQVLVFSGWTFYWLNYLPSLDC